MVEYGPDALLVQLHGPMLGLCQAALGAAAAGRAGWALGVAQLVAAYAMACMEELAATGGGDSPEVVPGSGGEQTGSASGAPCAQNPDAAAAAATAGAAGQHASCPGGRASPTGGNGGPGHHPAAARGAELRTALMLLARCPALSDGHPVCWPALEAWVALAMHVQAQEGGTGSWALPGRLADCPAQHGGGDAMLQDDEEGRAFPSGLARAWPGAGACNAMPFAKW